MFADFNADNYQDMFLCASQDSSEVLLNDKSGDFTSKQKFQPYNTGDAVLMDIDGNGSVDIYQVNYHHPDPTIDTDQPDRVYLNNGDGTFEWNGQNSTAYRKYNAVGYDFDKDGNVDILVTGTLTKTDRLLLNDGKGKFTDSQLRFGNYSSSGIALGDLDNDGDMDLIINHVNTGTCHASTMVWFNTSQFTSIGNPNVSSFEIFPNPSGGKLTISFGSIIVKEADVELYDFQGKLLLFRICSQHSTSKCRYYRPSKRSIPG